MLADLLFLLDLLDPRGRQGSPRPSCVHLSRERSADLRLQEVRVSCVHVEPLSAAAVRVEPLAPALEIEPVPSAHAELVELPTFRCVIEEEDC